MTNELNTLYQRDLQKTIEEINAYPTEEEIWVTSQDIKNPAGNLALHIAGNLLHFVGAILGKTGYVRNRDLEFSAQGLGKLEIISELEETKKVLNEVLPTLNMEQLNHNFPGRIPYDMNTGQFLLHLYGHLSYHLGQINYHRRLLKK